MRLGLFWLMLFTAISTHAAVVVKTVEYKADTTMLKGYLAYDDAKTGKRPGVLVVHEWWGLNDYARKRAEMLAELGYVALAIDMYGEGKNAEHPSDASKFSQEAMSNLPAMMARFMAGMTLLKNDDRVDAGNIAAIGYCFGGAVVLGMARQGANLKGVVSFHGSLKARINAEKGKVKTKILVCHGADDQFISVEDVDGFKEEMDNAAVDMKFISYKGATHGFTNPSATEMGHKFGIPIAYNEKADRDSWSDMQKFFVKIFKE